MTPLAASPVVFRHDRLNPAAIGPCLLHGRRVHVVGQVRVGSVVTRYQVRDAAGATAYVDAGALAPEPPVLLLLWRRLTGARA